jgi:predicted RNase H-related nuclease YkuK (DUF458 family)
MQWKTLSGKETTLKEFLAEYNQEGWNLYIGTDSQTKGRRTKFCTVLVAWKEGSGAYGIQHDSVEYNIRNLRDQLIQETWLSVDLAQKISPMVDQDITIHMDVNSSEKFKSGKHKNELIGFVKGLGFDYAIKPFSWVASSIADKKVR